MDRVIAGTIGLAHRVSGRPRLALARRWDREFVKGRVSIPIATFDRIDILLDRTIPALLRQTHADVEVIVVGDGTPEELFSRLSTISDPRLRLHRLAKRTPYPTSSLDRWMVAGWRPRNVGAALATGEWVIWISDDDEFVANGVELLIAGVDGVVLGIGDGTARRGVADEVAAAGLTLVTVVHPSAFLGPGVTVGVGCIVAPGSVLTRDVPLGRGVIVNYGANIGHDCVIGDFALIGPGAVLTGDVRVGAGSLVGAGAVILPGRSVGSGAAVGAGAVVTRDVTAGETVVGSPAKQLPLILSRGGE